MTKSFRVDRREFLRTGAALAGGLALPTLIPHGVLAAADRSGANDRIGIGYIGVGRRAMQLMNLPKESRFIAVSDAYLPRAEEVAKKIRCRSYHDYRRMLEQKDVDAVIIASPDHWHALHAIHACQAGKDVYVEKPMTLTVQEGRKMVEAARKYQRIVQCGSQQRSMGPNIHGSAMVRDGVIGKVHTVVCFNYPSPWEVRFPEQPVPVGLDWDAWCGQVDVVPFNEDIFTPRAKPGWISFRPFSGGEMTGWGAHGLDQIQSALGRDDSGPTEVWVEGEKFVPPTETRPQPFNDGNALCDHPTVFFRYADGPVVKLTDGPHGGGIFIGDKGRITIDRGICKVVPAGLDTDPEKSKRIRGYKGHFQNWFDCMRSRQLPVADVEIAHRSATMCHLGNIARWTNRKLTWDPVKETFPNDPEANAYLSRPQRKPYQLPESV
ncbi:MAG: Gfo/Idh/MocA family oxidoreductase [Pirellulales bacterium]|nr:Gfo/Idh/MocA family oxidoreductase [Pirellulales bacterium]